MTVTSAITRQDYTLGGVALTYPYTFKIFSATDLEVKKLSLLGIETTLALTTDYTVTGAGTETGGNVVLVDHGTAGETLVIRRNLPLTQPTSFRNQRDFYAERHEDAYDRLTMQLQQQTEEANRAILLPVTFTGDTSIVNLIPGYALGINATGDGVECVPNTGANQSADLANYALAAKGAGLVGYAYAVAYGANTVGKALKDITDADTALALRTTALEATDALDLLKHQIQTITATVASSALTVGLAPTILDFRSATLGSGVVNTRTLAAAASVVVPSGAKLGTVDAIASRVMVLALDNAGTVELAVVNLSGGNNLDETTLISTTAIDTGADAANVAYSTTARTSLPFRVVGYIESTQATAGTWATAPSTIQGAGGQALAAMSSIGYGQTWQAFTSVTRVMGTTYYNTTGKPIAIAVAGIIGATGSNMQCTVNGVVIPGATTANAYTAVFAIIPPGASYMVNTNTGTPTWQSWSELR